VPLELEFKEISTEYIRILGEGLSAFFFIWFLHAYLSSRFHHHTTGNWDPKTQESRYLSKMPTPVLQVIAGFEKDEQYSLPRCGVEPPSSLKRMLFPFIETGLENICLAVEGIKKERPTAVCTLQLWSKLRAVSACKTPFEWSILCSDACFHFSIVLGEFFLFSADC
jgi:hypothetical protein